MKPVNKTVNKTVSSTRKLSLLAAVFGVAILSAACSLTGMQSTNAAPMMPAAGVLSGAQEVPANPSVATGKSTITVAADKAVSGMVSYSGMTATAAHIHEAAAGSNGGVIVPLKKGSGDSFSVPDGAKLTDAQYASYLAGNLYVNVHSAAYPGGEIRVQLSPK